MSEVDRLRFDSRVSLKVMLNAPCVPGALQYLMDRVRDLIAAARVTIDDGDLAAIRQVVGMKLAEGFARTQYAVLHLDLEVGGGAGKLTYAVHASLPTVAEQYDRWVQTRTPPLFGAVADAKVVDVARKVATGAALDVGAGTGRNAATLATLGFEVDALEPVPSLCNEIRNQQLPRVRVFEGDLFDRNVPLRPDGYQLVVLSEVLASHCRDAGEAGRFLDRCGTLLRPEGYLVLNAFLPRPGYRPSAVVSQFSQHAWSPILDRRALVTRAEANGMILVSDDSTHDYERENLPPSAWPPTGWFSDWSRGLNIFRDAPEAELRWLVFHKPTRRT